MATPVQRLLDQCADLLSLCGVWCVCWRGRLRAAGSELGPQAHQGAELEEAKETSQHHRQQLRLRSSEETPEDILLAWRTSHLAVVSL